MFVSFYRLIVLIALALYFRIWNIFLRPNAKNTANFNRFLIKMGPSFIKFGQTLSTRPDIVGYDVARQLAQLQDNIPSFKFKLAKQRIERDFKTKLAELFQEFDEVPVAAASIAQVHFAVTKHNEHVAVKVTRPNIKRRVAQDIILLKFGAKLISKLSKKINRLKPIEVINFFEETIQFELDLRIEAASADQLRSNLAKDEGIKIPKIFWELTSKNVLTMEKVEGIPINNIEKIKAKNLDLKKIAKNLAVNFFNQTYRDGFFHGDMHPGNIFVDEQHNIILVDFGIIGIADQKTKVFVAEILRGFLKRDYYHVARIHFEAGYIPKDQSIHRFALACRSIGESIVGKNSKDISIGRLLAHLFDITEHFKMETQIQLLLLQKALILVEGVGTLIDPEINMWSLAEPWIEKWYIENISFEAKVMEALKKLPKFLEKMIEKKDGFVEDCPKA
ncbi:2-polyprenylphenol 6-hydroxylase [Rickettsiales endosymbiont of Stachyamoeba lipophora]|uniref:2-polyprenylphenol 6-hydroxylase n=1 Tax=Rickettsiales endosymbiont of Stachyamoeba lipophora TaxID=2486578 RepID=UPI000F651A64|nr:2-polyprenylphenol 6-hydroxylase [Rickettsiales endosymbiont of Stachyamoeba lipophora]AZL15756.1 2-polyprenylphenol 6-hydroxylase [Rickettsiales endosymbiont of Stachyamoeba lipophora]